MRYESWAFERIKNKPKCSVEPSMTCIPLRDDPICRACYEGCSAPREKGSAPLTPEKTNLSAKRGNHNSPPLDSSNIPPLEKGDGGGFKRGNYE